MTSRTAERERKMKIDSRFDDIRPYYDSEIPAAMRRIAEDDTFHILASYVFPGQDHETLKKMVSQIKTVKEFQGKIMWYVNDMVEKKSISSLSFEGIENLEASKPYLFVSNHRDIMLDASLLQNKLFDNGFPTTQITFGANLMTGQLIIDIGRSNKMFRVERGGSPREFYMSSVHLSDYIRHVITECGESVWIAQRNGRTKDGNDATDQGIIKMFGISSRADKISAIADLNIVPVSISYEWEPCDILKALELYQSRSARYVKKPGEDLNSVLTGITQQKGQVNISLGKPILREDLEPLDSLTNIEYNKAVAALLDKSILSRYMLYPNNFIAHDLRFGKKRYVSRYTPAQKALFQARLSLLDGYDVEEPDVLRDIFLGIYSNPVDNCSRFQEL